MLSTVIGSIVGIVVAVPLTIVPTNRFLRPATERAFYSLTLIPIALFYIAFCFYYDDRSALQAEIIGVILFSALALWAYFTATWILIVAYLAHALWDLLHEVSLAGTGVDIGGTRVPAGYAAFCLVYDVIIAFYIAIRSRAWASDRTSAT